MGFVRLIYASTLSDECGVNDLGAILKEARSRNHELGITGVLCYNLRYFLQWLEGPAAPVNRLYTAILQDRRHTEPQLIEYTEVDRRGFGEWEMGVVSTRDSAREIIYRYCPSREFNPYELCASAAVDLMIELAEDREEYLSKTVAELEQGRTA